MADTPNLISIDKYRTRAAGYDVSARFTAGIRSRTIAKLSLEPGQVVLDAGSGTGLSFGQLLARVGPGGRVIGVEQSPEMMALARERVRRESWVNVELIETPVEEVMLMQGIDAVLFNYAHDILQSSRALQRMFAACKIGAKVAVSGVKYYPWWLAPLNIHVWFKNALYNANPWGLRRPWAQLQQYVPDLQRESTLLGRGYIGWGCYRPRS